MQRKSILWISLITLLVLNVFAVTVKAEELIDDQGDAYFDVTSVAWDTGDHPAAAPGTYTFDLMIMVRNLTNAIGAVFELTWNGSLLNVTGWTRGDAFPAGTPTIMAATLDNDVGYIDDLTIGGLNPTPVNISQGSPAWAATLHFAYVGPTPAIGTTLSTDIVIERLLHSLNSKWVSPGPTSHAWLTLGQCAFSYEGVPIAVFSPTASFVVTTPPPYYANETMVDFDASASTGGQDGSVPTVITQYIWDFGDDGPTIDTDPYISHLYVDPGTYDVCLTVVAPGIGPYIDPGYVDNDTLCDQVSAAMKSESGIDVMTENARWPGYVAVQNGTGPDTEADAYSPQENVTLFAYVYYNGDAVQSKLVAFEIHGPENPIYNFTFYRTAITNSSSDLYDVTGWATVTFRLSWPCVDPEVQIFGTWTVYVSVSLAEKKYEDTLTFEVGYTVTITGMQTVNATTLDPLSVFKKGECIGVILNVTNIAMGDRNAIVTVVVYDDVGAVIGRYAIAIVVHPGEESVEIICVLEVPKYAFVGPNGRVYANVYTAYPSLCGVPWSPEVSSGLIEIQKA